MTFARVTVLTSALALISACGIPQKQLAEFGETAEQTVQVVGMASTTTGTLLLENEVTRNACSYLKGGRYVLASSPKSELSPLLRNQRAVSAALGLYASALAGALDGEEQAQVDAAGDALNEAVGAVTTQLDSSAQAGPIGSVFVTAIVEIEKNRRVGKVKRQMETVLPSLIQLSELLAADRARALAEMDRQIAAWDRHTRCVLGASRNKANSEATFRQADAAKRELLAKRKQAESAAEAMDKLIHAHLEIINGDGDFDEGIKTLNKFLTGLQAIKDA